MNIVTLTNGLKVGNFSSPHPFTFVDGTVLDAVYDKESKRLSMKVEEIQKEHTVRVLFSLTTEIFDEMDKWLQEDVDVVIIPLPMLQALHRKYSESELYKWPFRTVRMEDRINKLAAIDKFCL